MCYKGVTFPRRVRVMNHDEPKPASMRRGLPKWPVCGGGGGDAALGKYITLTRKTRATLSAVGGLGGGWVGWVWGCMGVGDVG